MRATLRWAALLLATILLAHLMNMVAFGYFAFGQADPSASVQAELFPTDQPPVDWLPVPSRRGVSLVTMPPDRAADNRAAAEDNS